MARKNSRSALGSSAAVEDYLERILELINSKGYARVVDIAAALKISQASVTNMVQRLDADGLLKYEKYRGLILTTAGKTLACKIAYRHQLLTDFLKLLGLDDRVIYHDVEGMEHTSARPRCARSKRSPRNCGGGRLCSQGWNPRSHSGLCSTAS